MRALKRTASRILFSMFHAHKYAFLAVTIGISLGLPLAAQKAKPNRIEFSKGSSSTVVQGQLRGREQMEYAADARSKQFLSLQLMTARASSLKVKVWDPAHQELALTSTRQGRWTVTLPRDGVYEIWVVREKSDTPVTNYKLRVTIR